MKLNLQKYPAIFIAIGMAIFIATLMVIFRSPMEHVAIEMPSKSVEAITAKKIPFRARVTAYGNVEPAITLNGMAEVSGKISYLHPNLKSGSTIQAGTLVVSIDAQDYTASLKQTQADLDASRSSLKQLQEDERSTRRSLQLARDNLNVGEAEFARLKTIWDKRLIAKSTLDAQEQKVIQLRQQLEELQGKMNSFSSRKASVNAQTTRAEQEVKNKETNLGRTEITLPFTARIGQVNIETNEFVAVGTVLFEAIDLNGVEINAQLPVDNMRRLVSHLEGVAIDGDVSIRFGQINDTLGLTSKVRLVNGMASAVWEAKVLRLSDSIDTTRQTLGVVVAVDKPYEKVIAGKRPPLMKGMYTAVDLYAPSRPAIVIPRKAVHQGRVYIINAEQRLEIRPVEVKLVQGDLAVIRSGIEEGEHIIISDLIPVIEGMPLQFIPATDYEQGLLKRAAGDQ